MNRSQVLVEISRGAEVEVRHRGALVVVDCEGNLVHASGDPDQRVFIRSAIKPFVAALVVQSGAVDALGMTPEEIAIMAASHSGTDEDVAIVRRILERIGRSEDDLEHGPRDPDDQPTMIRLAASGEGPTPARHMCSGEHAGLLALAHHRGWPTAAYSAPDHPAQQEIEAMVVRLLDEDAPSGRALDDCGLPTWAVPLVSIARAYGWLAQPDGLPSNLLDLQGPFRSVRDAMLAHPVRIGGAGMLDSDLIGTAEELVAKEGAEGLLGIGSVGTGLGIALSIDDGDKTRRASGVVAMATLSGLRLLDGEDEKRLYERHWPSIRDPRGEPAGEIRTVFRLPPQE